jgi:hypothetical protein
VQYLKLLQQAEAKRKGFMASDCREENLQPELQAWQPFDAGF